MIYVLGGSSDLSYKVIASQTAPTSPTANMIWIKSGTAVNGYRFASVTPSGTSSSTGNVYFICSTTYDRTTDNTVPVLNILNRKEKGQIIRCLLHLTGCRQVINGEWKAVNAYLYKGGSWLQFSAELADIDFYNAGTENATLTLSNVTKASTYLNATLAKSGNASVTIKDVDLTNHKTVTATYSNLQGDGTFKGYISLKILDTSGASVKATTEASTASGTLTLDVSTLTGKHQIQVYMRNTSGSYAGSCRVSRIRMLL